MTAALFSIEMLPADHGDCLWIEYGDPAAPSRILIDGGPTGSNVLRDRVARALATSPALHFELLVVTHIDDDHIAGVLDLLQSPPPGVSFGEVWFNAYKHLEAPDRLGAVQGERLSDLIEDLPIPWNAAFSGFAVVVPSSGILPSKKLPGGMSLTLLSPTMHELTALRPVWASAVREHLESREERVQARERSRPCDVLGRGDTWPPEIRALAAKSPERDGEAANGSSIALLAEYGKRSVLLGADGFAPVLERSLLRLLRERKEERLNVGGFKIPHHGSRKNISNGLLQLLRCPTYLVSTSGKRFAHPDNEAIARILVHGGAKPRLVFNYASQWTLGWRESPPADAPAYEAIYLEATPDGFAIAL